MRTEYTTWPDDKKFETLVHHFSPWVDNALLRVNIQQRRMKRNKEATEQSQE